MRISYYLVSKDGKRMELFTSEDYKDSFHRKTKLYKSVNCLVVLDLNDKLGDTNITLARMIQNKEVIYKELIPITN